MARDHDAARDGSTHRHDGPDGDGADAGDSRAAVAAEAGTTRREDVVGREKDQYGGIKFGSAFFGWLTATGTAVLLTALVAAIGADAAASNADTVTIVSAVVLAVVLFVAYFCGGYVAGRMARFDGLKQGVAVWLWAVVIAIVVAILTAVAGSQFDVLGNLNAFPRIPVDEGDLTVASIVTVVVAAIVGGLAGMRFHRKVDRAGLGR
jgi:MFS family permease